MFYFGPFHTKNEKIFFFKFELHLKWKTYYIKKKL